MDGRGDVADAELGWGVATAGDVNGDGYSDLIVGAYTYTNDQSSEGRAFVYLGSSSGISATAAWTAEGNQLGAGFGFAVACAGDVNGDGYSDVIVGSIGYDNGQSDEGRASVYHGSALGLSTSAAWTAESDQASAIFGYTVATAGDVNGDGYSDVVVGAYEFDNGQTDEGRAFVYLGSSTGLSPSAAWTVESNQSGARFGLSAATAGDVNGDGYSDVIVGAYEFDNGQTDEGRAFLYLGSSTGLSSSAAWTTEGNQIGAWFGYSVASAGDANGDGYSDVVVGAPAHDNGQTDEGRTFVYLGSGAGLTPTAAWTAESDQGGGGFGAAVATAGDVNGDGYSDVIVGAFAYDNGLSDEGAAFLYLGSATGLASGAAWTVESDQLLAFLGASVATVGDANGDGYSDVVVGAPWYANGQLAEGRAFVYYGNEGRGGWTLAPQQRRASDAAPIALLGRSNDKHEFRLRLGFERALAGFTWASGVTPKAQLEWEVAPLRLPLDGSRIESGAEQSITGSALSFNELVEFRSGADWALPFGIARAFPTGVYHWRARVRTNNPLFPVTPWVTLPWNNVTETKLRVLPPLSPAVPIAR
ncbi:MAG: FG-GAP-like repeat-containing protein [Planctomycetota bacterium]